MTDAFSRTQCFKPMNPGLKCLRQRDHQDFKASLGHTVRLVHRACSVWTRVLYQKTKTNQPSQQQQKPLATGKAFYTLKDGKKTEHVEMWKTENKNLSEHLDIKTQSENRKQNMRYIISQCMEFKDRTN